MSAEVLAPLVRLTARSAVPMAVVGLQGYEVLAASGPFNRAVGRDLLGVRLAEEYAAAESLVALLDSSANGTGAVAAVDVSVFRGHRATAWFGPDATWEWAATPFTDAREAVVGILLTAGDTARTLRAAERLEMLEGLVYLSQRVSAVEDEHTLYRLLAEDMGVLLGCGACVIARLDNVASRDPNQRVLRAMQPAFGLEVEPDESVVELNPGSAAWRVVFEGETFATDDCENDPERSDFGDLFRSLGAKNGAAVPMRLRGQTVSLLIVLDKPGGFNAHDLDLAEIFAAEAALAIENARLFAKEHRVATALQEALLPGPMPAIAGFDLAALYRPAGASGSVGGDFYDVFRAQHDTPHYGLVLGDVSGKGPEAAAQTSLVRHMARGLCLNDVHPGPVAAELNRAVYEQGVTEGFITMIFGVLEAETRIFRWANAGHPPPMLWRRGEAPREYGGSGLALGIAEEADLRLERIEFAPGDVLVLYTDGLAEARRPGGHMLGVQPLLQKLGGIAEYPVGEIAEALYDRAVAHSGRLPDDVALLVVKCAG